MHRFYILRLSTAVLILHSCALGHSEPATGVMCRPPHSPGAWLEEVTTHLYSSSAFVDKLYPFSLDLL